MKLSILIPVYGKVNFTSSCLKDLSLLNTEQVEIIVIDNASSDETPRVLTEKQNEMPNLVVIRNEENLGFGKALNKGYEKARGEFILFLNNDIRVSGNHSDWTNLLTDACQENTLVGPTGAKIDERDGFAFRFETSDLKRIGEINYISGWNMAARKDQLDKLVLDTNQYKGPWNERFFAYFEDGDLSFRALEKGWKLKMVSVPVIHFGKITSSSLNLNKLYNQSKKIFCDLWASKLTK